uniref:Uncharacterized protein n=1 Tax=Chromera velia CCMP2878 TaxID=1169474 RepID=A0A0G4FL09_9ALVE
MAHQGQGQDGRRRGSDTAARPFPPSGHMTTYSLGRGATQVFPPRTPEPLNTGVVHQGHGGGHMYPNIPGQFTGVPTSREETTASPLRDYFYHMQADHSGPRRMLKSEIEQLQRKQRSQREREERVKGRHQQSKTRTTLPPSPLSAIPAAQMAGAHGQHSRGDSHHSALPLLHSQTVDSGDGKEWRPPDAEEEPAAGEEPPEPSPSKIIIVLRRLPFHVTVEPVNAQGETCVSTNTRSSSAPSPLPLQGNNATGAAPSDGVANTDPAGANQTSATEREGGMGAPQTPFPEDKEDGVAALRETVTVDPSLGGAPPPVSDGSDPLQLQMMHKSPDLTATATEVPPQRSSVLLTESVTSMDTVQQQQQLLPPTAPSGRETQEEGITDIMPGGMGGSSVEASQQKEGGGGIPGEEASQLTVHVTRPDMQTAPHPNPTSEPPRQATQPPGDPQGVQTQTQAQTAADRDSNMPWHFGHYVSEFRLNVAHHIPLETPNMKKITVGCPGLEIRDAKCREGLQKYLESSLNCIPVFLQGSTFEDRYCEAVLSPLFHYRTPPLGTGYEIDREDWLAYERLNQAFCDVICNIIEEGDKVIVFDYHLMLLPSLIRQRCPSAHIGFYLNTVFPSSEMYRILPQREELLRGVLAADMVAFHSFQYKRHFLTACTRVLGIECTSAGIEPCPEAGGTGARVVTVPRGMNPEPWLRMINRASTIEKIQELRKKIGSRKLIIGIDTLDYIKGIPHKMLAFNKFLQMYPQWATQCVFLQITLPLESTEDDEDVTVVAGDRQEILRRVYQVVGAINAQFGTFDAMPVHFLNQKFPVEALVHVYACADVAVITSLRESLSWTAYEYILCQQRTNKGVLVLSEFSGSAQSLGAAAICVNPWDINTFAMSILDALEMPDQEKIERHDYAYRYVVKHTAQKWGEQLISEFREAVQDAELERVSVPPRVRHETVQNAYKRCTRRLFILGFRGTMFPLQFGGLEPELFSHMGMPDSTQAAIRCLSEDPRNRVVVLSSSSPDVLERALGKYPHLFLVAENGHVYRKPGRTTWETDFDDLDSSWMENVREILAYFVQRTPGSFTHETKTSVSWHYQNTQRDHGSIQARDLLIHLCMGPLTNARADVVVGSQSVEVRAATVTKALILERILKEDLDISEDPRETMVFCVGNFLMRDEEIFSVLQRWHSQAEGTGAAATTGGSSSLEGAALLQQAAAAAAAASQSGQRGSASASAQQQNDRDKEWGGESGASGSVSRGLKSGGATLHAVSASASVASPLAPSPSQSAAASSSSDFFTCTVGRKNSRALFHLTDPQDVATLLTRLARLSLSASATTLVGADAKPWTLPPPPPPEEKEAKEGGRDRERGSGLDRKTTKTATNTEREILSLSARSPENAPLVAAATANSNAPSLSHSANFQYSVAASTPNEAAARASTNTPAALASTVAASVLGAVAAAVEAHAELPPLHPAAVSVRSSTDMQREHDADHFLAESAAAQHQQQISALGPRERDSEMGGGGKGAGAVRASDGLADAAVAVSGVLSSSTSSGVDRYPGGTKSQRQASHGGRVAGLGMEEEGVERQVGSLQGEVSVHTREVGGEAGTRAMGPNPSPPSVQRPSTPLTPVRPYASTSGVGGPGAHEGSDPSAQTEYEYTGGRGPQWGLPETPPPPTKSLSPSPTKSLSPTPLRIGSPLPSRTPPNPRRWLPHLSPTPREAAENRQAPRDPVNQMTRQEQGPI